jgi:hypothetical protein
VPACGLRSGDLWEAVTSPTRSLSTPMMSSARAAPGSRRPWWTLTDDAGDAFLAILTNGKVIEDKVEADQTAASPVK